MISEGQVRIATERARDRHDRVIVTEKLDGSNVAITVIDGKLAALTRAGYLAASSPYEQHHRFGEWVSQQPRRFLRMLNDLPLRLSDPKLPLIIHGEWLAQSHGTLYDLPHEPFVVFDVTSGGKRLPWATVLKLCDRSSLTTPRIISDDGSPQALDVVKSALIYSGHGVATGEIVEGAVWRVERRGVFDFMAKWVDPDKVDGKYFPENTGADHPVWNHLSPAARGSEGARLSGLYQI